ncbi:LytTR family transcriptional regulator [Novosphingobium sp. PhB165]|uniref:LytTR family DNA-binding domain-containing protein n=1 Tax=Novosphingobium sp. PhB165 TaxID=2485105 RepID=UPI0010DA7EC9|nr:LytTR family DNA-binding domain-containing protein [Novosphingobium sp. PhB165]TCM15348.1 LytTR family transcriptional regulator [Novosphingobium sp. PhB165]
MSRLRQFLLELWAMLVSAAVIGFLGPFGTYLEADFPSRVWEWWAHLMGAYIVVRPAIGLWVAVADATSLPRRSIVFWGVIVTSFPLTLIWQWVGSAFFHALGGFAGILPFALLSAMGVLVVVWWARRVDEEFGAPLAAEPDHARSPELVAEAVPVPSIPAGGPRLSGRLSPQFAGPIQALQSEDHYVRVHGVTGSELLFMRLRDAIAEMDGMAGQQVHRSWWIAQGAVASIEADGRSRRIVLANGATAQVARESVGRLESSGFLSKGA